MRAIVVLIAVAAVGYGIWHFTSTAQPSATKVEPLLHDFLADGSKDGCTGTMTVTLLERVSVGEYSDQFGGWPVYANHKEVCNSGGSSSTYDGSQDSDRKVAAAFVRRNGGKLEIFTPGLFQDAQKQMQQAMQNALNQAQSR